MKNFKFYTKAEIKKSVDEQGKEVMKIGGIASTIDEDADGEFLDPKGFEVDDFLTLGFVNWHHQAKNKPKTIVGEPLVAEIRPEGFYVECLLYPSSDTAREIYETAEVLQRDSKTRRLGFSIEGEVIERGSEDENHPDFKKVIKANITGLAITHMPKNAKTFAEIIKGHIDENDSDSEESTGINTKKNKGIIKESVDEKLKVLAPKIEKSKYKFKEMSEEVTYDTIFETFTDISIEKAEKVYRLLTIIKDGMSKGKIDDDKLEKALETLNLSVSDNPFLSKAKEDDFEDDDEQEDDSEDVEKGKDSEEDDSEDGVDEAKKVADKIQKEFYGGESGKKSKEVKKSRESDTLIGAKDKGISLIIQKAISHSTKKTSEENKALGVLIKSVLDENDSLKNTLNSFSQGVAEQNKLIKGLFEKIEEFGSSPQERKSIVKGYREKFEDDSKLEKGNSGAIQLSKSRDRQVILDILDKKTFTEKGFDENFSKATLSFESNGIISREVLQLLGRENIIITD